MINEDEKSRGQEDKQKTTCHPELVSGSHDTEIPKQVRNDVARSNQTSVWDDMEGRHCERSVAIHITEEQMSRRQEDKQKKFKNKTSLVKGRGTALAVVGLSNKKSPLLFPPLTRGAKCAFTLAEVFLSHFTGRRKIAFTLAEVLITLGIIGVVAAMTLPALITKHQKKVVATRVKQFASVWPQAYRQVGYEQGTEYYWGTLIAKDPESTFNFYNETFGKYLRTIKVEKSQYGITGALQNGSGFYFYRYRAQAETSSCTYLIFCPYYKDCKQLADNGQINYGEHIPDGKKTFGFYLDGKAPISGWDGTREWLMQKCSSNQKGYCTTLIQYDGWEIKDDYPAW